MTREGTTQSRNVDHLPHGPHHVVLLVEGAKTPKKNELHGNASEQELAIRFDFRGWVGTTLEFVSRVILHKATKSVAILSMSDSCTGEIRIESSLHSSWFRIRKAAIALSLASSVIGLDSALSIGFDRILLIDKFSVDSAQPILLPRNSSSSSLF